MNGYFYIYLRSSKRKEMRVHCQVLARTANQLKIRKISARNHGLGFYYHLLVIYLETCISGDQNGHLFRLISVQI
jgi:hypothetical protein